MSSYSDKKWSGVQLFMTGKIYFCIAITAKSPPCLCKGWIAPSIDQFQKWRRICYSIILHKLECFIEISTTEKNRITTRDIFFVWDSQLAADTSLAIFRAVNEWQRVLFLQCELSRHLLVSKMFIYWKKIIHGYLEIWNFSSCVQLDLKFRISAHPCIILYVFILISNYLN